MSAVSSKRVADISVEVADTLIAEFDVITFLQVMAERAAGLIDDATVGLLLADPQSRLHFMAAFDEATGFLEIARRIHKTAPASTRFTLETGDQYRSHGGCTTLATVRAARHQGRIRVEVHTEQLQSTERPRHHRTGQRRHRPSSRRDR